jgi:DMSO reductase family type II enzyme heme b subunit
MRYTAIKLVSALMVLSVVFAFPAFQTGVLADEKEQGKKEEGKKEEGKEHGKKEQAGNADEGKKVYDGWCAQCHGYKGDGKGYTTDLTMPKPRDFAFGTYKFRSTPSGDPPTDVDIIRSIKNGNPGTSMPPWSRFSDDEVRNVTAYVKKFAPDIFADADLKPIKIENPPKASADIIAKGKELFTKAKCVECHGKEGRGNGDKGWQEKFKNDWGDTITPANYTNHWELRNGSELVDIFRTISVGIAGTPMTSYMDSLPDEDRWALAHFIKSLQVTRKLGLAFRVKKVAAIPATTDDKAWDALDYLDLPIGGQLMFEPRYFTSLITNARVRGVYTDTELAIMVEWTDKKPDDGSAGTPPDAVRVQFPTKKMSGPELPYFFMGGPTETVNTWFWKASEKDKAVEATAKGLQSIADHAKQNVKVAADYKDGLYRVVFKRALKAEDAESTAFEIGKFMPIALQLYDGRYGEEGAKANISAWYYFILEPPPPITVFVLPPLVGLIVLAVGVGLSRRLRCKSGSCHKN